MYHRNHFNLLDEGFNPACFDDIAEALETPSRDHLAMAALVGLLSSGDLEPAKEHFATMAYRLADAMLEERKK